MSKRDFNSLFKEPAYIELFSTNGIVTNSDVLIGIFEKEDYYLSKDLFSNRSWAYYIALEKMAEMNISRRVNILRTISDEIVRVSSHLFNLSILFYMINSSFILARTIKIREVIQDIKKLFWNSKIDIDISVLGSVKYDIDTERLFKILKILDCLEPRINDLITLCINDKNIIDNSVGVGVLTKEDALKYGAVGPVARASGINNDIRIISPYGIYDELKPKVILHNDGDVYARMFVRCYEIQDSLRMLKKSLDLLLENRLIIQKKPQFSNLEAYSRVEAPRGELFNYVKIDKTGEVLKNELRVPSHVNWQLFKIMVQGNEINKVPVILNSIDPCLTM